MPFAEPLLLLHTEQIARNSAHIKMHKHTNTQTDKHAHARTQTAVSDCKHLMSYNTHTRKWDRNIVSTMSIFSRCSKTQAHQSIDRKSHILDAAGYIHPPAAACSLIFISGTEKIKQIGWLYLGMPVIAGTGLLCALGMIMNNFAPDRKYPLFW